MGRVASRARLVERQVAGRRNVAQMFGQLAGMGANHLLLNPVSRHAEQLEALAAIVKRS